MPPSIIDLTSDNEAEDEIALPPLRDGLPRGPFLSPRKTTLKQTRVLPPPSRFPARSSAKFEPAAKRRKTETPPLRNSSSGRGPLPSDNSKHTSQQQHEAQVQAFEKEVVSYVIPSFAHYDGVLGLKDRTTIATRVLNELLAQFGRLVDTLASKGSTPSSEQTTRLAERATQLVIRYAEQEVAGKRDSRQPEVQEISDDHSTQESEFDDIKTFDRPLTRSKRKSSSPPTSLSTDNDFSEDEKDEDDKRRTTRHAVISIVTKTKVSRHVPPTAEDITRPYISAKKRNVQVHEDEDSRLIDHIDFNEAEVKYISAIVRKDTNLPPPVSESAVEELSSLMAKGHGRIDRLSNLIDESLKTGNSVDRLLLRGRGRLGIKSFLTDVTEGRLVGTKTPPLNPNRVPSISIYNIGAHLIDREMARPQRGRSLLKTKIKTLLEDSLVLKSTWIDSCGDVSTISWRNENAFVCGATAHSDHHNMQYNKPGNLLLGSLTMNVVKEVPDHRIPRPRVESQQNRENSLHSMRETQDPWLYTSVVASSYSDFNGHNLTFTASFDKTVKIWRISEHGDSIALLGTWEHKHNVNFVVTSRLHGRAATAADVSVDAIRVYQLGTDRSELGDVANSLYHTYNGSRALEQAQQLGDTKWAYYPATIQWGKCEEVKDLLLVGYSPRSLTGDDSDIPEDRKNTGELCLWDIAHPNRKIGIPAVRLQNVFEVQWHPTQACFIAATSPSGSCDSNTLTQIRVFMQTLGGEYDYTQTKTLDCSAPDINEITIMPNSAQHSYVTASCTDNNVYVWDTATGDDNAIHVLSHGEALVTHQDQDLFADGAEGVKFACWGRTADRLYTGSTDGIVKAWNVRSSEDAFVRDVLKAPGQISSGAFSPDFSKLLIGDATGKIHLLACDDSDLAESASESATVDVAPIQFLQNRSDGPKDDLVLEELLREGVFEMHLDPFVGVVQGPNYHNLNIFSPSDHEQVDISKPLKWETYRKQICLHLRPKPKGDSISLPRLPQVRPSSLHSHTRNIKWDDNLRREARAKKLELEWDFTDYDLEESPDALALFSDLSLWE